MKLKPLNFITLLLFVFNVSFGQQSKQEISFEQEIQRSIEDKSSDFFYPKLLKKIEEMPDKITKEEIKHLYYGQIYKSGTGLSFIDNKSDDVFRKAIAQNNCKKILLHGYLNLKENPILLTTLIPMNSCLLKTNETDSSLLDLRVKMLLEIIFETGDGKTKESAIKIANIEDDYILKTILGFKGGKESLEIFNSKPLSVWDNGKSKLFFEDCWNYKYK